MTDLAGFHGEEAKEKAKTGLPKALL